MDALVTVHRYWPSVGGTEALVEGIAREMVRAGHSVTVATSAEPGSPAREERGGVEIRRFELKRAGKFRFPGKDYRAFVRDRPRDVLVAHGQRVWSTDYVHDVVRKHPKPVAFMAHGFYQWHMGAARPAEWLYYHRVLPYGFAKRHVVAETEGETAELARFGFDRARIDRIGAAFDPAEFAAPRSGFRAKHGFAKDEPLLLYVGGFYDNKRVEDLVRVAARANARLVIVGKDHDPDRRAVRRAEALAKDLAAPVSFLGAIPRADVLAAFHESTLFLLASKFEGYGIVLLEAMAAGLPFVATRAGAAPELAALGAGASLPSWEDMARETARLLADPDARRAMGAAGRAHAGEHTIEKVAAAHARLYERAIREQTYS